MSSNRMKLKIFLVLLACCLYLTTARPNDIDSDNSKEKSQPATAENSENEFDDGNLQPINTKYVASDAIDLIGRKPLHELAELLYSYYTTSKWKMIESLEQIENLEITILEKSTDLYKQIYDYVNNTQLRDKRLDYDSYEVDEIFKVYRHEEQIRYEPYERNYNRQLLIHGTQMKNLVGILENGLKVSSDRTGQFGKGIYFSDSISKSAPYSRDYNNNEFSLVLLCEVALGVLDIRHESDNSKLRDGCESVQTHGQYYPHPLHVQPDGLKIPNGVLFQRNATLGMRYNEFVVSDEARVKIRYLVKLKLG